MNSKKFVLVSVVIYVVGATLALAGGFLFSDPDPVSDPAQSLIRLNDAAQSTIATRTNEQVDKTAIADPDDKAPSKVKVPTKVAPTTKPDTTNSGPSASSSGSSASKNSAPSSQGDDIPEPSPSACGQGGTCTAAEVAAHNSQSDCWVRLGFKAYNVTPYVNSHPGGRNAFDSSTCGTDITAQMQGQAGSSSLSKKKNHDQSAYNTLNSYFVANISD